MIEDLKARIKEFSLKEAPKEACGFILQVGQALVPTLEKNVAEEPLDYFSIDARVYLEAIRDRSRILRGYWHSHPVGPNRFSQPDKSVSERMQLPLYLYSVPDDALTLYRPVGYQIPLEGRPFVINIHDCAGLVIDYYQYKLGIVLSDFPRTSDEVLSGFPGLGTYVKANGLNYVDTVKTHDIIMMQLGRSTKLNNHCGVMVDDHAMLHQLMERPSARVVYGGYWKQATHCVLRHDKFMA